MFGNVQHRILSCVWIYSIESCTHAHIGSYDYMIYRNLEVLHHNHFAALVKYHIHIEEASPTVKKHMRQTVGRTVRAACRRMIRLASTHELALW